MAHRAEWVQLEFFFYRIGQGAIIPDPIIIPQMRLVEINQRHDPIALNPDEIIGYWPRKAGVFLKFEGDMDLTELHRLIYDAPRKQAFHFALMARRKEADLWYQTLLPDIEAYNIQHRDLRGEVVYEELAYDLHFTALDWVDMSHSEYSQLQAVTVTTEQPSTLAEILAANGGA